MQQGIGRAGFLLLALVTFAIGAFGFALTWEAFQVGASNFFWMGLGVSAISMLALFVFASLASASGRTPSAPVSAAARPGDGQPAPRQAAAPSTPEAGVEYEFGDYEPAAKAAPEKMVLPQAFSEPVEFRQASPGAATATATAPAPAAAPAQATAPRPGNASATQPTPARDPAAWPGARGKSTWTHHVEHQKKVQGDVQDARRRQELSRKYTQTTPTLRAILDDQAPPAAPHMTEPPAAPHGTAPTAPRPSDTPGVPERLADRAPGDMNTDFVAPGMNVGQCGQCQTLLLAPEQRPLRLKCPECAKVTLLQ